MEETQIVTGTRTPGLRSIGPLSLIAAALTVSVACSPYDPLLRVQTAPLPGVHATAACIDCHVTGPPFYAFPWDPTCLSCHEQDRKPPAPPAVVSNHHVGQGCAANSGCHADVDPSWRDRDGVNPDTSDTGGGGTETGFGHGFLPLQGGHPTDCTACHLDGIGASSTVTPEGGTAALCWSCHEEDRYGGDSHFVYEEDELPTGAELRRDCKACHDVTARTGGPFAADWSNNSEHGGIRFPHGMENNDVPADESDYVTACTDCHSAGPPAYDCTVACHEEVIDGPIPQHATFEAGDDDTCTGCHIYADIRPY